MQPIVYDVSEMSGFDFEEAVETLLDRLGYDAGRTEATGDSGRDVIAERADDCLVIECKCTQSSVGRPVVQKLHSAAISYREGARGLVVCTGGFSRQARDYASGLDDIELWDWSRLKRIGSEHEIYFEDAAEGPTAIFKPPEISSERLRDQLLGDLVRTVRSTPRATADAIDLEVVDREFVGGLLVDYSVRETFGTRTYPNLHRVSEAGRRLFVPDSEARLPPTEREIWQQADFSARSPEQVGERPARAHFGFDADSMVRELRREIAARNSTVVHYTGDNNQTYAHRCEVEPEDVSARPRRVLLDRRTLRLSAGPTDYSLECAVPGEAGPAVVRSEGISAADFRSIRSGTDAYLCNDCGAVELRRRGAEACARCDRTLCSDHAWTLPSAWPGIGETLCAGCYRSAAAEGPDYGYDTSSGLGVAASILFPWIPWWLAGRYALTVVWFAALAASAIGFVTPHWRPALGVWSVVWTVASVSNLVRWLRSDSHRQNLSELESYRPPWPGDE